MPTRPADYSCTSVVTAKESTSALATVVTGRIPSSATRSSMTLNMRRCRVYRHGSDATSRRAKRPSRRREQSVLSVQLVGVPHQWRCERVCGEGRPHLPMEHAWRGVHVAARHQQRARRLSKCIHSQPRREKHCSRHRMGEPSAPIRWHRKRGCRVLPLHMRLVPRLARGSHGRGVLVADDALPQQSLRHCLCVHAVRRA